MTGKGPCTVTSMGFSLGFFLDKCLGGERSLLGEALVCRVTMNEWINIQCSFGLGSIRVFYSLVSWGWCSLVLVSLYLVSFVYFGRGCCQVTESVMTTVSSDVVPYLTE